MTFDGVVRILKMLCSSDEEDVKKAPFGQDAGLVLGHKERKCLGHCTYLPVCFRTLDIILGHKESSLILF